MTSRNCYIWSVLHIPIEFVHNYYSKKCSGFEKLLTVCLLCVASMGQVAYKYFMMVSPLDGKLYISDYQSNRILRVKTMGAVRELSQNMEVIAGTGEKCVPGDRKRCGDNGPAVNANLFYPKGKKELLKTPFLILTVYMVA